MPSPTTAPHPNQPVQPLAWHSFQFLIPKLWEVTAYSTSEREGRLEFNTRSGVEAQLSWQKCKREPNIEETMNKFHRELLHKNSPEEFKTFKQLSYHDYGAFKVGFDTMARPCQAALYQEEEKQLLRWIFPRYDPEKLQTLWVPLWESYQPNNGDFKHWAVFGLDVMIPKTFQLETIAALPANVMLIFEGGKRMRLSFHRWGIPDLLLGGRTLAEFYEDFLVGGGAKIEEVQRQKFRGMEGVVIDYNERAEYAMDKLYGRWQGQGTIWYNREELRIYAFEQVGSRKAKRLELNDVIQFT
ncbi:MAG: hypothetical protein JXA52_01170 [Planctomycetes bacterium]|nr:hypothetical protein [Planctomycetota bacterium]